MNYKKIYLIGSGYSETDWIPCEICSKTSVDIHHIEARGMGGTKKTDEFNNLMALCRECHLIHGDITYKKDWLKEIHKNKFN